jgi:hypothetical protein
MMNSTFRLATPDPDSSADRPSTEKQHKMLNEPSIAAVKRGKISFITNAPAEALPIHGKPFPPVLKNLYPTSSRPPHPQHSTVAPKERLIRNSLGPK